MTTKAKTPKVKAGSVTDGFECGLKMQNPGGWEAQAYLPLVGSVTVTALSWEDAKLKLWLISEALNDMERQAPKTPIGEWSEAELRSAFRAMRDVLSTGPE